MLIKTLRALGVYSGQFNVFPLDVASTKVGRKRALLLDDGRIIALSPPEVTLKAMKDGSVEIHHNPRKKTDVPTNRRK